VERKFNLRDERKKETKFRELEIRFVVVVDRLVFFFFPTDSFAGEGEISFGEEANREFIHGLLFDRIVSLCKTERKRAEVEVNRRRASDQHSEESLIGEKAANERKI
jgi:hypothetical protein